MSLFSFLFGSKVKGPPKLPKVDSHIAFVLLGDAQLPSEEKLLSSFGEFSADDEKLSIVTDDEGDDHGEILMVELEGVGTAFVALMPTAVPGGEAESFFEMSLSSFPEDSKLEPHRAHLIVTLMGVDPDCPPLKAMMAFTSLLAALVDASPSVGVYWGNVSATHTADFFTSIASDKDINARLMLWNGFSRAPEDGERMSYLSYGMNQLELPDLYLICKISDGADGMGRVLDLLAYIAQRGEAIPAGDTIGATENERIKVEYVKSPADKSKTVWKIEM